MTVTQVNGKWAVVDEAGSAVATFETSSAAWRWLDQRERRPLTYTARGADRHNAHYYAKQLKTEKGPFS